MNLIDGLSSNKVNSTRRRRRRFRNKGANFSSGLRQSSKNDPICSNARQFDNHKVDKSQDKIGVTPYRLEAQERIRQLSNNIEMAKKNVNNTRK